MKFDNILILSDFDGTFAGKNSSIVKENIEAIEYFKANGGHFSFSTGRLPSVMKKLYPEFRSVANAPLIMSNGAVIYDPIGDSVLNTITFSSELGKMIASSVLELYPDADFALYPKSGERLSGLTPDRAPDGEWLKMNLTFKDEKEAEMCRDLLRERYSRILNVNRSNYTFLELVSRDASKGNAVRYIKDHFENRGYTEIKAVCIGDFENDIDMLKKADLPFCPENAIEEVKALCLHTVCHHDLGAIADMIRIIEKNYI